MLRLLEHYAAPQGEGPNVGVLSQFVRFAGCNLKCPGWPCDTPQAIQPAIFEKEQQVFPWSRIADQITDLRRLTGASNVVFTGGEPLLQNQEDLAHLVHHLLEKWDAFCFEMFTNGTRPINEQYLVDECTFIMDWKLPGSGEDPANQQRIDNLKVLDSPFNAVKFVIATQEDLVKAHELHDAYLLESQMETYVGVAWGRFSNAAVVNYVKRHQLPWRLNVQVHNYVFGAHRRYT